MKFNITSLVRTTIHALKPYSSARDDFKGDASIFLDANENPYPTAYNRYPDPHQQLLKEKIASLKKISTNHIFLGNGSDEAIDLLIRAFCEPNQHNVIIPQPTYGMYSVCAAINAIEIKNCTLTPDFDIDITAIQCCCNEHTKIIFLCSPNNPTGNLLSIAKIKFLLTHFTGLIIVDEAYIDFAEQDGVLSLLPHYPNLVILQTLSKAWGLAYLRLGMCFASPKIISVLNKIKPPYNISGVTQEIVIEKLSLEDQKNKWVADIIRERKVLEIELKKIHQVKKVFPSQTNFLLIKIDRANETYQQLIKKGIIVRDRSNVILCTDCLRITIGTADENRKLLEELKKTENYL